MTAGRRAAGVALAAWALAAACLAAGAAGPGAPSAETCCRRVVFGETSCLVLDNAGTLWRRAEGGERWQRFAPLPGRVQDVSGAAGLVWVLTDDRLACFTESGVPRVTVVPPEGAWSIAAEPLGVWVGSIVLPGRHEIGFWRVSQGGEVAPVGRVLVPLEPAERAVFERAPSFYAMLVDAFQLAAGTSCAAFLRERSVFVPCRAGAVPVRWASRGMELEPVARAVEQRDKLSPIPLPQVANVVAWGDSWWVLEHVTALDPETGKVSHRDRVRRIGPDGSLRAEVLLGGIAMGIGARAEGVVALMADGSPKPVSGGP